jgi:hypothetical protein
MKSFKGDHELCASRHGYSTPFGEHHSIPIGVDAGSMMILLSVCGGGSWNRNTGKAISQDSD